MGVPFRGNADPGAGELRQFCELDPAARSLIRAAMRQLGLSARAYHRVLKLVRTVADLACSEAIAVQHLAEGEGVERRGGRERRLPIPCPALSSLEQASPLVSVSSARCAPWPGRERTTRPTA